MLESLICLGQRGFHSILIQMTSKIFGLCKLSFYQTAVKTILFSAGFAELRVWFLQIPQHDGLDRIND